MQTNFFAGFPGTTAVEGPGWDGGGRDNETGKDPDTAFEEDLVDLLGFLEVTVSSSSSFSSSGAGLLLGLLGFWMSDGTENSFSRRAGPSNMGGKILEGALPPACLAGISAGFCSLT